MPGEMSKILSNGRIWHRIASFGYPEPNTPVAIRSVDYNSPVFKEEGKVLYLEEVKVARLISTDGPRPVWVVEGPHPIFDYSALSNNEVINATAETTHWSPLGEGELEAWHDRFAVRGDFKDLVVKCDERHKETVYRSLSHAALVLYYTSQNCNDPKELKNLTIMINTLYDMQACMDLGGEYHREAPKGNTSSESE